MTHFTTTLYVAEVEGSLRFGTIDDRGSFVPSVDGLTWVTLRDGRTEDTLSVTIERRDHGSEVLVARAFGGELEWAVSLSGSFTCPFVDLVVLELHVEGDRDSLGPVDSIEITRSTIETEAKGGGGLPLLKRLTPTSQDATQSPGGGLDPGLLRARSFPRVRDALLEAAEKLREASIALSPASAETLEALTRRGYSPARVPARQPALDVELATETRAVGRPAPGRPKIR